MRRGSGGIAIVAIAAVLSAGPAAAGPVRGSLSMSEVEALFAQVPGGANGMFAQIVPSTPRKGYDWTAVAYKESPSAPTNLAIYFARDRAQGTQFQAHEFTWVLARRALRMDTDLKPASLTTGKGMGENGSIRMRLTKAGRYFRFPAEEGCSGAISIRGGRFGGRFRFDARDEYFGRISMRGARVLLFREHDYRCAGVTPPPPCPPDLTFNAADTEAGVAVGAFKTPEGKVDQTVVVVRELATGQAHHVISVMLAVPESFEASDDLSSATVDGGAGGPWLSGELAYLAPPGQDETEVECGPYRSSSGLATGDYTAHFDSIGDVTPASTGMTATLRREL